MTATQQTQTKIESLPLQTMTFDTQDFKGLLSHKLETLQIETKSNRSMIINF